MEGLPVGPRANAVPVDGEPVVTCASLAPIPVGETAVEEENPMEILANVYLGDSEAFQADIAHAKQ